MEIRSEQLTGQGTRLDSRAPWETYGEELVDNLPKALAEEVSEYAKRRYDQEETSNQNLEELAYQKELSQEVAKDYQWLVPEEYADVSERIGRVMHSAVFISKLRSVISNCWYTQHPQIQKAILVIQDGTKKPEVACWVQQGQMPELSIMRFDERGIPLDERRRGWRTALLQLILKGYITEEQANTVFGRPGQSPAFDRYNRTLFAFKKRSVPTI